jgi:UDP-GlcNAc:undecaprenyl-phosphate GlcNAc-1-phosphate transferase
LFPFLISLVVSFCITPLVTYFYTHFGWLVDPKKTKHPAHVHQHPVPKGGGIPVYLATLAASLVFLTFDKHLWAITLAGGLVILVGVLDDIFDLNPYLRLLTNWAAALIVVGAGIGIAFVTNPLGGQILDLTKWRWSFDFLGQPHSIIILADIFALLWIPFVMNAINWSKGLDGQLPGIVVVSGIVIGLLSLRFSGDMTQWPVAVLAFALAGAYAGYLPFNFFPQKSMPGYGGGSYAGFMLATLAILSTTKVGTALVVLGIPFIDAVFTGTRRILHGRSPFYGDQEHLHHHLLRLGWSKPVIAVFYWTVTALLGLFALKLNSQMKFYTIVLTATALGGFLLWLYFGRFSKPSDRVNG